MAVQWRRMCYVMMAISTVLMLATLVVAVVRFTQPRVPPSCLPERGMTATRGGASSLAPPSTAESDIMNQTRGILQQAVEEIHSNYQAAELFRTKMPQGLTPFAHVPLKLPQTSTRNENLLRDDNSTQSMLQRFEYDQRGYLRVPEDGCYFIYAHLQYEEKPGIGFDRDRLKDYIFRTEKRFVNNATLSEKLKKGLLFNGQTPCKVVPPSRPLPSSYQGAVVCLKRDDMLSVASSLPKNIHKETAQSYFGVYLV